MATRNVPLVPMGEGEPPADAAVQRPWPKPHALSSPAGLAESLLERAAFDRAPWLTIAFAGGMAA